MSACEQLDARASCVSLEQWLQLGCARPRSAEEPVASRYRFLISSRPTQEHHVLLRSGADTYVVDTPSTKPTDFATAARTRGCHILQAHVAQPPPCTQGTAKITFTSGTTGQPKGVCLSRQRTCSRLQRRSKQRSAAQPDWRHLCVLPLSLLLENVAGVYANLGAGHEICVPRLSEVGVNGSSGLDVARFMRAQNDYRPQSIILVPQLLLAMTAAAEFGVTLPDKLPLRRRGRRHGARVVDRARATGRNSRVRRLRTDRMRIGRCAESAGCKPAPAA